MPPDSSLALFAPCLPRLRSLSLVGASCYSEALPALLAQCCRLQELTMLFLAPWDDEAGTAVVAGSLSTLRTLTKLRCAA
jgi:hypothetical protein